VSIEDLENRIEAALEWATWGQEDGAHHKTWAIDQMVRALTGPGYEQWVREYENRDELGVDPEDFIHWDTGIAP
jgi:hypothetical protein